MSDHPNENSSSSDKQKNGASPSPKIASNQSPFELSDSCSDDDMIENPNSSSNPPPLKNNSLSKRLHSIPGLRIRQRLIPENLNIKNYTTYDLVCTHNLTMRGTRYHFQLSLQGFPLFHVKMKSRRPSTSIPISSGSEMHLSQPTFAGYLLQTDDHQTLSLRRDTEFGDELMTIKYAEYGLGVPKKITVNMFLHDSSLPTVLVNKQPQLVDGIYFLSFGDKEVISSVKNCILIGEENNYPYLFARKIGKDKMQFDAFQYFTPLDIISFGISLFIAIS